MNSSTPTTSDRKKAVFGDLRGWIDALRQAGELAEIDQEVNWDVELGTIIRMAQGTGSGPASTTRKTSSLYSAAIRRYLRRLTNPNFF